MARSLGSSCMADERILLIDDDEKLTAMLAEYLEKHGFRAQSSASPRAALRLVERQPPDLVILDVMMPEMDGLEVCREIRRTSQVPILMLTARGDEADRIVGLELGADDYLAKPFNPRELVARVRSILRRVGPRASSAQRLLVTGPLAIDPERREVRLRGERVELTSTEFDVLFVLAQSPGRVLSREVLMSRARGARFEAFERTIDVHISHIRQKIEDDPKNPRLVKTVWGEGYVFTGD
jgi:two-component system phosphate regulon response regulator OmpR